MKEVEVYINDVTLREGDQAPLTSFNKEEKKVIALMLGELGVNCIEVGFGMSRIDFENIRAVIDDFAKTKKTVTVSSLGRSIESDTKASLDALDGAKNRRIHSFIATSDEHINAKFEKFGKNLAERKQWVLQQIHTEVSRAKEELKGYGEVEFSPEDATNSDFDFLIQSIETAIKAGASILNIPDTLGSFLPHESEEFFRKITEATKHLKKDYNFEFSCHIHNDLAVSTANAIASIRGGARWIEVTQNGIGERTGNTMFHEIVGILKEKSCDIIPGCQVVLPNINEKLVGPVSYFLETLLKFNKALQKPFIGELSDKDGSGVHNASADVYGGKKNKRKFGGKDMEEFFSPRGGANQVLNMLKKYGVSENKGSKVIQAVTQKAAGEAEVVKAVYSARLYSLYLEELQQFRIISVKITNSEASICVRLKTKEFCIYGEGEGENGVINGLVNGINSFLERDIVEVERIKIENKPCLGECLSKFFDDVDSVGGEISLEGKKELIFLQNNYSSHVKSKQVGVAKVRLRVDGKEVNLSISGNDVQEEILKAIVYGSLYELYKKA